MVTMLVSSQVLYCNPSALGREAPAVPDAEESSQRGRDETPEGDRRDEHHVRSAQHSCPPYCRWETFLDHVRCNPEFKSLVS
jgi:hypothetical protein